MTFTLFQSKNGESITENNIGNAFEVMPLNMSGGQLLAVGGERSRKLANNKVTFMDDFTPLLKNMLSCTLQFSLLYEVIAHQKTWARSYKTANCSRPKGLHYFIMI